MQLLLFIPLVLVVAAVDGSAAISQPQSNYCKRFEAAVQSYQHNCEKQLGIFPVYSKCLFSCSDKHKLSVFDCHFRIEEKNSYPLCTDLYCSPTSKPVAPQSTSTAPAIAEADCSGSTVGIQPSTYTTPSDSVATSSDTISSTPLSTVKDTSGETFKEPQTTTEKTADTTTESTSQQTVGTPSPT